MSDSPWTPPMDGAVVPAAARSARLLAAAVDALLAPAAGFAAALSAAVLAVVADGIAPGALDASTPWVALLIADHGQTIGKRWMALRIVTVDGRRPSAFRALVVRQWVCGAVNAVVPGLWYLDRLVIFGSKQRCLHDWVAGTVVIADIETTDARPPEGTGRSHVAARSGGMMGHAGESGGPEGVGTARSGTMTGSCARDWRELGSDRGP